MTNKTSGLTSSVSSLALAGVYVAAQQPKRAPGDWPSYGGTNWSQKYSPLDQITADNFKNLKVAWTWRSPDHELLKTLPPYPEMPLNANGLKGTPLVVNGVMYMSTGLDQIAAIDPATGATKWLYNPEAYKDGAQADVLGWQSKGVAYWTDGTRRADLSRHARRLSARARREDRTADQDLRRRRQGRSDEGSSARDAQDAASHRRRAALHLRRFAAGRRARHGHRRIVDVGSHADHGVGARLRRGVRRAHRQIQMGVSHRAARRRVRRRHLEGSLEPLQRQRQRLVDDERRRRARSRVPAADDAEQRLLGRISQRRRSVRREPRRRQRRNRQARLAFSGGASRRVGLRLSVRADAARRHRQRQADQGDRAGEQAGIPVRVRSRDRQAALADRGASGSAVGHSRRGAVADAAVSDQAAGVRSAGRDRNRSDRLHAGAEGAGARDLSSTTSTVRCSRRRRSTRTTTCAARSICRPAPARRTGADRAPIRRPDSLRAVEDACPA